MTQTKSRSLVIVHLDSPVTRALILLPALLAIFACWFVVRWYVANTVAEYAVAGEQDALEMARLAERWAPSDPFPHWQVAALTEKSFNAINIAEAVREYQLAASLSPYDYRYWMELADGLEASGDQAGSERAFRRAVELAPAYAQPHWFLGNLLLRAGKLDEGFEEVRRAAIADDQMRPQLLNLAWQVFNGDVNQIARAACPTPDLRIQLATYLVGRNRVDDAMRVWSALSANDRVQNPPLANDLKQALLKVNQFKASLQITRDTEPNAPAPEQIWDGGFETRLAASVGRPFYWAVTTRPQAEINLDPDHPHNGRYSLRIVFSAPTKLETISVTQTVVVQPNAQYRFEGFVRTRNLNSGSTPQLAMLDAADDSMLGQSPPTPTGNSDWQKITFDFKTKPATQAVKLSIYRPPCGEGQLCPIFGNLWYDDFNIQRSSGTGAAR